MPPERAAALTEFLLARLNRAVEMATTDVLAELWARQLSDTQVLDFMDTRVLWRKVAAAREVGERRLLQARTEVEAAARDPRQDLAAVATAALGRLGRTESVPVLTGLIDSEHPAVVDAALASLADIGDEAALGQLRQAAAQHPDASVRQRAAALLQERAARPTGPRLP
jgi:HEAT repeat protein